MSFIVLEQWNKTPMDLGIPVEDIDPVWLRAMLEIKNGYALGQKLVSEHNAGRRPH